MCVVQIFSDIVFAEKNYMDENFSREGYDFYLELRNQMLSLLPVPHVVLYLDVSPEECYNRIHKLRKRVRRGLGPFCLVFHVLALFEIVNRARESLLCARQLFHRWFCIV